MFVRLLFYSLFGTFGKLIIFCIQKRYFLTNFEFYFFEIDMNPSFFAIMRNGIFHKLFYGNYQSWITKFFFALPIPQTSLQQISIFLEIWNRSCVRKRSEASKLLQKLVLIVRNFHSRNLFNYKFFILIINSLF